ncbi:MAG TPA: peptide chain release factor 2 [Ktedonobacterales bacterium]|nr:peptide chain release factor 2 [Ktedonobacterales bacterium]
MSELMTRIEALQRRVYEITVYLDLAAKKQQIAAIEEESLAPDFYNDRVHAQRQMQTMSRLRDEVFVWESLDARLAELHELTELLETDPDSQLESEIDESLARIEEDLEKQRFRLLLNGPHDAKSAIVSIHAGNGGTDAMDWVQMLQRAYMRWAESHGYKVELLDEMPGEEAGIKSTTFSVGGPYAYGYLRGEAGAHRLIRLSPFDAAHRRQTSFAKVEVMPDIGEEPIEISIRPEDLEVDTFRSTGKGGQHLNKTDSAVRIRHKPTGIVVTCQNERSQIQNRELAMRVLKSRLYELEIEQREREASQLKGTHVEADFGNQIRTVTLHPYTLVKDHRTGAEMGDTTGYLNGDIDRMIEATLTARAGEAASV